MISPADASALGAAASGRAMRAGLPPAAAAAYAAVAAQSAREKNQAAQELPRKAVSPPAAAPKRGWNSRVRLLPVTILAVALLLGLKVGTLWQGRGTLLVNPASAQQNLSPTQQAIQAAAQAQREQTQRENQAAQQQQQQQGAQQAAQQQGRPAAAAQPSAVQSLADRDPTTFTRAEIELLANLAQRREQLEQRAREIDLRESLLAATEKRIDERIAELKKLESSIKQIVQTTDKQDDENLKGLVKVYEAMKPEDAARIFEKLDANVLLGVVERMKEAKLATVFAKMDPATAQQLTVRLATRRQLPQNLRAAAAPAAQAAPAPAQPQPGRPGG